jgi:hypothetical protein
MLAGAGIVTAPITGGTSLAVTAGAMALGAGIAASGGLKPGNDVVSRPGYGERALVTPNQVIALNDQDNIVAYADDMIAKNAGVELLSKGAIVNEANNTSPTVNIDMSKLENKLDRLISNIDNITNRDIYLDGQAVGKVLVNSESRVMTDAVFRAQRM